MRYPDFLAPGGRIGFIAPSFGCSIEPYRSAFDAALALFQDEGYTTVLGPNCYEDKGTGKSNTPEACGAEINDFFLQDRADVIISCGGGETMCEDLPFVDFEGIRTARPHWYLGYSDNTNLTFTLPTLCDTAALYGPCAASFGMQPLHASVRDAFAVLTGSKADFANYEGWEKESLKDVLISRNDEYVYQKESSGRLAVTKYIEDPDLYLVVESGGSVERRQLVNMLILNIVLCIGVLIIMLLAVRIIIARTRALTHASFMDQSTQLLNRRAFEERKAELSMSQLEEDFVYLTADLNGLKRVNDQLGHAAGDELIKGAAVCLKECFGRYGKIYRIGGDEFAAMLHLSEAQLEEAMKALDQASERWTGQYVKGLSLSCGYALSREFPSENIAELGRISDERMYEAKQAHYRKTGNQR